MSNQVSKEKSKDGLDLSKYRKPYYDYITNNSKAYELEYDNGVLKLPDTPITLISSIEEKTNLMADFDSNRLFLVNEDFDKLYIRKKKFLNLFILSVASVILIYLSYIQFYEPDTLAYILIVLSSYIFDWLVKKGLKITGNLEYIYDFDEYDI